MAEDREWRGDQLHPAREKYRPPARVRMAMVIVLGSFLGAILGALVAGMNAVGSAWSDEWGDAGNVPMWFAIGIPLGAVVGGVFAVIGWVAYANRHPPYSSDPT